MFLVTFSLPLLYMGTLIDQIRDFSINILSLFSDFFFTRNLIGLNMLCFVWINYPGMFSLFCAVSALMSGVIENCKQITRCFIYSVLYFALKAYNLGPQVVIRWSVMTPSVLQHAVVAVGSTVALH